LKTFKGFLLKPFLEPQKILKKWAIKVHDEGCTTMKVKLWNKNKMEWALWNWQICLNFKEKFYNGF